MDKKDKIIENLIDNTLDELNPPQRLLQPAMNLLQQKKNSKKTKNRLFLGISFFGSFSLIFIIIISSFFLINNFNNKSKNNGVGPAGNDESNYYHLKDLAKRPATVTEASQIISEKDLNSNFVIEDENIESTYTIFYFSNNDSNAFLLIKQKINAPTGLEEIKIVIELTNNAFYDYKDYFDLPQKEYNNKEYYSETTYINGEYVTKSFFAINNINIYYDSTSPNSESGENYLKTFLN